MDEEEKEEEEKEKIEKDSEGYQTSEEADE